MAVSSSHGLIFLGIQWIYPAACPFTAVWCCPAEFVINAQLNICPSRWSQHCDPHILAWVMEPLVGREGREKIMAKSLNHWSFYRPQCHLVDYWNKSKLYSTADVDVVASLLETFLISKRDLIKKNQKFKQKCFDPVIINLCKMIHWPLNNEGYSSSVNQWAAGTGRKEKFVVILT